jgi:very-short-patch-repair endonuclease
MEHRDEQRTAYLKRLGYRVIRFWNTDVFESPDDVADAIAYELGLFDGDAPLPSLLPCGERGRPSP